MCKFCKPDEFGDGVDITKPIKSKEVRIGLVFNAMSLEAWVLDGDEHKPKVRLSLTSPEGDDLVRMDMPIKYCPMCGRKL